MRKLKDGNNKGFTLVEVMTAVAIIGLVITAITGFMVVGSRTFASTSSEVNLQYESQLAFNQLQDLVIDTSLGIAYSYVDSSGAISDHGTEILSDAEIPAATSVAYKKLYMYNDSIAYVVIWDAANSRLFYEEHTLSVDPSGTVTTSPRLTDARMADYINGFAIDLNRLESKRIVRVDMDFEKNNKTYSSSYNITLRNDVIVNEPLTVVNPTPSSPAGSILVDDVCVEPGSIYTYPTPTVTALPGHTTPSQVVRWFPNSVIDVNTGRMQVSTYETREQFNVEVITLDNVSANSLVKVRKVRDVTVTMTKYNNEEINSIAEAVSASAEIKAGDTFELKAVVNDGGPYPNLTPGVSPDTTIEKFVEIVWDSILPEGCADYLTISDETVTPTGSTCKVTVKSSGITNDQPIKVRATSVRSLDYGSNQDRIVYGEWIGMTDQKDPDFIIDVVDNGGDYLRGQEYVLIAPDGSELVPGKKYILYYDLCLKKKLFNSEHVLTGYEIIADHYKDAWYATEGGNNGKVEIPADIDPEPYAYDEYVLDMVAYAVENEALYNSGIRARFYDPSIDYSNAKVSNTKSIPLKPIQLYFGDKDRFVQVCAPRNLPNNVEKICWEAYPINVANFRTDKVEGKMDFRVNPDFITWKLYDAATGRPCTIDSELLSISYEGTVFKMKFNPSKWDTTEFPKRMKLIPTLHVVVDGSGRKEHYELYKSYVDIIMYNITIGDEKLYFPYPGLDDFPGKELESTPGKNTMRGTWYNASNFSTAYSYELTRSEPDGREKYTLVIYEDGKYDLAIATRYIYKGDTNWTIN